MVFVWISAALAAPDVLMLGNSYTAQNGLPTMLQVALREQPGWEAGLVRALTSGGWTWHQHTLELDRPGSRHALAFSFPQDVVILQEQSQIPGFPAGTPDQTLSDAAVVELDAAARAAGAESMLYLTWGRRAGDPANPVLFPDFSTMQDRLTAGYLDSLARIDDRPGRVWVSPAGEVFRAVHNQVLAADGDPLDPSSDFYRLYGGDGSHPSVYGSVLIAAVHTAVLTGRVPFDLGAGRLPDEAYRQRLMATVEAEVVQDPFGPYPYRFAFPDLTASPGADLALGLPDRRGAWQVTGALDLARLEVGVDETEARLWVVGEVQASEALTVGGRSEVLVQGVLSAPASLTLDARRGPSLVSVQAGGRLEVEDLRAFGAEPSLQLDPGAALQLGRSCAVPLALAGAQLETSEVTSLAGDLTADAASRLVLSGAGTLEVAGAATLRGTLELRDQPLHGERAFVQASSLDRTGLRVVGVASPRVRVDVGPDGEELVVSW